jgi:lipopolysaccharide biosynthesis glycosyltransferase
MGDRVHIVLAADANYASGLRVTRESMVRSCAHPERLEFHVVD